MLASYYAELRAVHIICAVLSFSLFLLRGFWMMRSPQHLSARWVRVLPHVIDTVLLTSAIALTMVIRQYPLTNGWLTAKLVALLAYIVLGTLALKRGRTLQIRIAAFAAAVLVFLYIVATARAHQPLIW